MLLLMDNYIMFIAIWCLIINSYIVYTYNKTQTLKKREKKGLQNSIYIISSSMLIFDLASFMLVGRDTVFSHWIMSIAYYMLYLLKYMYITAFIMFLMKHAEKNSLIKKVLIAVSVIIGLVGMLCLSLPGIREKCCYIDNYNYVYYGSAYSIIRFLFILDVTVMLIALLHEKKHYRTSAFYLYLVFIVNLMLLGFLDYFIDEWYIQDMTIFFSTIMIFIDYMMHVSDKWSDAQKELVFTAYRASHDLMTGLWNKTSGMNQIREYMRNMSGNDAAVLGFIDIDDFKSVNDNYGHETGDFWICEIAKALQSACDYDDIVCRYGGDEYVIFMKNIADTKELISRMENFKESVYSKSKERDQNVHCSIGLYQIDGAGNSLDECIIKADELLYQAKKNGKDRYEIGKK